MSILKRLNLLIGLAATLIPFLSHAQVKDSTAKSLLWEVSGKDLKQPSYIYGTIHLISSKDFVIRDKVKRCTEKSSRLVMEMDVDPSQYQTVLNDMTMPCSLDSLLSPEEYGKVSRFVSDSLHLGMLFFDKMKPFFTYQTIYTTVALGSDIASYELKFSEMFREEKKPVEGLETLAFQMAIFDKIPYKTQAKMLVDAVEHSGRIRQELHDLVELYKQEDLQALAKPGKKDELDQYSSLLLEDRNSDWIPKIRKLAAKETVFIAVGAAHLAGNSGILSLLRREGYTVKPVF